MYRILFTTSFWKFSGGQAKAADYFDHAERHPGFEPYLLFTPRFFDHVEPGPHPWRHVPEGRVVAEGEPSQYDLLFVTGKDWKYLPKGAALPPVIALHQSLSELDDPRAARHLARPAFRICASRAVYDAVAPRMSGEAAVVPNGIPLDLFRPGTGRREGSVLVWGRKDPDGAARLTRELRARGRDVTLLLDYAPRERFAEQLAQAGVFAGLPHEREGFFLPALEAMACGAAVVCADAGGNRDFCLDGETCLTPPFADLDAHVAAVERLLDDAALRERLRGHALEVAREHSLEGERAAFYRILESRVAQPAKMP